MRWNEVTYSGWGKVLSSTAKTARPERHAHLADIIIDTQRILPVGNCRSYGDAPLAAEGNAIRTERLDRMLSFDKETGVLEAEAGIKLGEILRLFSPLGWMPAVLPGTGMTTLGGAIANDIHGKNHHVAGSFGEHVESITIITAEGKARTVSAKKDANLFRATIGGVGQTGLISSAKIKLAPCASTNVAVKESRIENLSDFMNAFETSSATYQVGWIDALASGDSLGRGIFEQAEFAGPTVGKPVSRKAASLPITPPGIAVSAPFVKLFNALYFRRVPSHGRSIERSLSEFFFPLDKVSNWNRLYGKNGFYQFQCVIPDETAKDALTALLSTVSDAGIASPLAVLKRMGSGRAGMMSFPLEGYTLAIDLPNKSETPKLLAELGSITEQYNGRLYLAKDGAATANMIAGMYDELPTFQKAVQKIDPEGKFVSQMSERLGLRGAL